MPPAHPVGKKARSYGGRERFGNPGSETPSTLPAATRSVLLVQEHLHFAVELQTILLQENDVRRLADLNQPPLGRVDELAKDCLGSRRRRDAVPVSDYDQR